MTLSSNPSTCFLCHTYDAGEHVSSRTRFKVQQDRWWRSHSDWRGFEGTLSISAIALAPSGPILFPPRFNSLSLLSLFSYVIKNDKTHVLLTQKHLSEWMFDRWFLGKQDFAHSRFRLFLDLFFFCIVKWSTQKNTSLTTLNLYYNKIGPEGAKSIAEMLKVPQAPLQYTSPPRDRSHCCPDQSWGAICCPTSHKYT